MMKKNDGYALHCENPANAPHVAVKSDVVSLFAPDVPRGHVAVCVGSNCRKVTSSRGSPPDDVPEGHVAVRVGSNCRRYIVPATHLNHPILRRLLDQIGEEYGFPSYSGLLWILCDTSQFEKILRRVDSDLEKCIRTRNDELDRFGQSPLSLLCGFTT